MLECWGTVGGREEHLVVIDVVLRRLQSGWALEAARSKSSCSTTSGIVAGLLGHVVIGPCAGRAGVYVVELEDLLEP